MAEPLLTVRALCCRYAGMTRAAVEGVSFDVEEGELLALVGPSGCGKSTTLRAVAGLEPVASGEIAVRGRALAGPGVAVPPERRGIGLVFQDLALFPHLGALQNVAFGLSSLPARDREARARRLLELVSLQDFERRRPGELSGGQQQRVALARALAPEPPLLLLDEPFSSLDAALRDEVRREVRALLKRLGKAAILVTHDRDEVFAFADRVAVMNAGRLEQAGPPDALYAAPATAFVASLLGECTLLPAEATGETAACALGQVRLTSARAGKVRLVLRPEALRVQSAGGGEGEGVRALVQAKHFRGSVTALRLSVPGAKVPLLAHLPGLAPYAEGEEVRVGVRAKVAAVEAPVEAPVDAAVDAAVAG